MTRFEQEISGSLGEAWKGIAQRGLDKIKAEYDEGKLTVDEDGVLRNCIGRVAVKEVCEKCQYLGIEFNAEETERTRERDTAADLAVYRKEMANHEPNAEERYEMEAAFGKGAKVKNALTGKEIEL